MNKTFRLFGIQWNCRYKKGLEYNDEALGMCVFHKREILLDDKLRLKENKKLRHWVLLHELMHAALMSLQYSDLNKDESFIDGISGLLHQALDDLDVLR